MRDVYRETLPVPTLTPEQAVAAARALAPACRERAQAMEALRRPHDDFIEELIASDLLGLMVPKRYGGHEADLGTFAQVVSEISRACLSSGWTAAFYIGHNWMAARADSQVQKEIFAGKNYALIPTSNALKLEVEDVKEGVLVSGRAGWSSGMDHCDWVLLSGVSSVRPGERYLLPRADVALHDTWHTSAMAGTGSGDVVVDKAFVPTYRILPAPDYSQGRLEGALRHNNPIYQMPDLVFVYCEMIGIYAGGLRGAVEVFEETLRGRTRSYGGSRDAQMQFLHIVLGEALARADVCDALVRRQVAMTQACMARGEYSLEDRIKMRANCGFAVDLARTGINDLIQHSSSSAFALDKPLQRFFRDINMIAQHAFLEWDSAREQYGRLALDLEPNTPLI